MNIIGAISRLFGARARRDTGSSNPSKWFSDWVSGGGETASGVRVTEQSAMKYTPFFSAVRIISGTLAALPFLVYRRLGNGGKKREPGHIIHKLLHDRPNDFIDAITFIETRMAHVLTYGNGFAEIQRDGAGRPVALWPLLPNKTFRKIKDGVPYYEIHSQTGEVAVLADYNVLHIKGLGFDGYTGYNVVQYHKEAIGYGKAVKEYGARFFGNDASPGGVLEHPQSLGEKAYKRLQESWDTEHRGLEQAHRMRILEEGMKYNKTGVDPEHAQALEVQKWTVDDCSRIFQIPPHKLGSMEFSKYNNVEQLQLDFVATTMLYWFRKWEQECNYKLFMPSEQKRLFTEILVDGLLRSDIKSRYAAYKVGRDAGFLCVDDIREKENMNPLPDGRGKIFLEPLNMKEAGSPDPDTDDTEGGDDKPAGDDDDDVRNAHRNLIASQWGRVITKQNKAKDKNGDFWPAHRKWAANILFEPVNAYASTLGVGAGKVRSVLDTWNANFLVSEYKLNDMDAGRLADEIMKMIGANNEYR